MEEGLCEGEREGLGEALPLRGADTEPEARGGAEAEAVDEAPPAPPAPPAVREGGAVALARAVGCEALGGGEGEGVGEEASEAEGV